MDRDPLPRGSFQVTDRLARVLEVVGEPNPAAVAVEAENATYVTEHMIVVNTLGVERAIAQTTPPSSGRSSSNSFCPMR
jgi:hypothetical protein